MLSIILAFVGFVALGLSVGMLGVAWPSIQETFELPLSAAGILLAASTGGAVFASSISGRLILRLETGWLLVLSGVVASIGFLGQALAPSWWFMVALALLAGVGGGWIDSAMNIYVAQHHSGRVMNWLHACFGLGATLGPSLMTAVLVRDLSWRIGYGVAAAIQAAMIFCFFFTRKQWQSVVLATETAESKSVAVGNGRFILMWLSILIFLLYAGVESTAGQWSFSFYTNTRGLDVKAAGNWVAIYWGSLTIGRIFFGFIANSIGPVTTLRACMFGIIIGAIGFMMPNTNLSLASLALIGFVQAPIFPLLVSETPKRLGAALASRAIGYQVGAAAFGIATLPGLAGIIAQNWGLVTVGPFILIASIIFFAIHEVVLWQVRGNDRNSGELEATGGK